MEPSCSTQPNIPHKVRLSGEEKMKVKNSRVPNSTAYLEGRFAGIGRQSERSADVCSSYGIRCLMVPESEEEMST